MEALIVPAFGDGWFVIAAVFFLLFVCILLDQYGPHP